MHGKFNSFTVALQRTQQSIYSFYVPVKKESSLSIGGTIIFLALFGQNLILGQHPKWVDPETQSVLSKSTKKVQLYENEQKEL